MCGLSASTSKGPCLTATGPKAHTCVVSSPQVIQKWPCAARTKNWLGPALPPKPWAPQSLVQGAGIPRQHLTRGTPYPHGLGATRAAPPPTGLLPTVAAESRRPAGESVPLTGHRPRVFTESLAQDTSLGRGRMEDTGRRRIGPVPCRGLSPPERR